MEGDMEDSLEMVEEMVILGMVGETESLLRRGLSLPLLQDPSQKRSLTVEPRSPTYLVVLSLWTLLRKKKKSKKSWRERKKRRKELLKKPGKINPALQAFLEELSQWIQLRGRRKLKTRSPS